MYASSSEATRSHFVTISMRYVGFFSWLCPLLAVFTTLIYTYAYPEEYVNYIQFCPGLVTEYQPVSAFSGRYLPQSWLWQLLIVLHFPNRIIIPRMVWAFYKELKGGSFEDTTMCCSKVRTVGFPLEGVVEALGLVLLSVVDMDTNVGVHEIGFIMWAVGFLLFLFNDFYFALYSKAYRLSLKHKILMISKLVLWIVTITICVMNFFIYLTYRALCSEEFYTWFIITEYVVVCLNLVYHLMVVSEWSDASFVFHIDMESYVTSLVASQTLRPLETPKCIPALNNEKKVNNQHISKIVVNDSS